MEEKLIRFLKLSEEFTVKSDEVYDGFEVEPLYINSSSGCYTLPIGAVGCGFNTITNDPPKTKLEQFETAQLEKIEKAKRYEEYLTLRTDLLNYYNAKEKLNN